MEQFGGKAVFVNRLAGFDPKSEIAGNKVVFFQGTCGTELTGSSWETDAVSCVLVASAFTHEFRQSMSEKHILTIELDKQSIEDVFHTFSDKDTDCTVKQNEDGTAKVKLISGSLSKSYKFRIDDFVKQFAI